jgi:hypothetical protein
VASRLGSGLFTFLVEWLASVVSLPPGNVIWSSLPAPLNDVIYLFTSGIGNLSLYKLWLEIRGLLNGLLKRNALFLGTLTQ